MSKELEQLVKTTTKGSLIILIGQVSSSLILALGMLLVARFLGAADYGAFNKAQSVVQIAFLLINLGIPSAMIKYIAQYRHQNQTNKASIFIETGIILSTTTALLLTITIYLIAPYIANNIFHEPAQLQYIRYLSISIIGQQLVYLSQGITVGYERMELRSMIYVVYAFAKSIISPVLVYIGLGTLGAILGHTSPILLSGAIGAYFIIILYRSQPRKPAQLTHREAMKTILTYGFPLYLSVILTGILPHIYTTLLGVYTTNTQIGNYSVALNFSVLLSFVTLPIGTTIFPLFSKLDTNNPNLEFLYRNAVKYSTLFGYPIIFTVMALADPIINALFGYGYPYAANYLRLFMLAFTFIGIGSVSNPPLLNSQQRTDLTFKSTLARFIIALPLGIIAIQHYGVTGLLLTRFISSAVNTVIDYINIQRIYKYTINKEFLIKISATSIITYYIVYTLTNHLHQNPWIELIIGGTLSLTIYLPGLIVTKALTHQDYKYIDDQATNLEPLAPIIHKIIAILDKPNKKQLQTK